ncbi:flagellar motor switch protein FliM [Dissulfurirhabdus thermomarina]|uniref:Flagellar motor switch protein FliM n=1 Tax=Dissulfurirhabdus thermomarina TaxID=1765737 RepID=A0A6N9TN85_DISTH|nr:flagellar motor switch protein FliM [Dissulfurirhabdus thermomarina]NDY42715.1 flagellar motor switch protein FliM [Dissulfurirhabdus thermomarina]NMX24468.1 flagellar motor switch protein FliM [Dissulfurirhabdus thermomarina]
MSQVLSQEEIDALLGGLEEVTAEEAGGPAEPEGDVVPYDFVNFTRMTKIKLPAFDVINDQFNRGLRNTLSGILRLMVESAVVPPEVITFKEFLRRLPVPSNLHILKMEPFRGHVLLSVDSPLVFTVVEIFLGSTSFGQARIEGREFTSIEQRMIRRVVNALMADMERAWAPVHPVKFLYERSEINPQFAKIAADDDAVIISRFQLDMEEVSGAISICIPMLTLQPIKAKLQSAYQHEEAEDPVWRHRLLHNLRQAEVDVVVPLGAARLTGSELLDLSVGDIIQLDTPVDGTLVALVEDRPKLLGHPGIYRGQRAFKVAEFMREEEP